MAERQPGFVDVDRSRVRIVDALELHIADQRAVLGHRLRGEVDDRFGDELPLRPVALDAGDPSDLGNAGPLGRNGLDDLRLSNIEA